MITLFHKIQPPVQQEPGAAKEHLRAADKFIRLKRYKEALSEIERAHELDPADPSRPFVS